MVSPRGLSSDLRCLTAIEPRGLNTTTNKAKEEKAIIYMKADWIDKIIRIKEGLDKKCN